MKAAVLTSARPGNFFVSWLNLGVRMGRMWLLIADHNAKCEF
jgi:hypothetical protein